MFAMTFTLIWDETFSSLTSKIKEACETVAALFGVFDSHSVTRGCCILFQISMNRHFVCRMTLKQWLLDGCEHCGGGHLSIV